MTDPTPAEALKVEMATKIADLKALSQKANDGAWFHYDKVFRKKFGNGRITEIQRYGDGKAIVNWAGFDGLPDVTARKKNNNARFIVELVNFFRKHADDLSASLATLPRPPAADAGEVREGIARIVDPASWRARDRHLERVKHWEAKPESAGALGLAQAFRIDADAVVKPSLAKADAILALPQAPSPTFADGVEASARVAENEPELPGDPPVELAHIADELRATIRTTKRSIAAAIRKLGS